MTRNLLICNVQVFVLNNELKISIDCIILLLEYFKLNQVPTGLKDIDVSDKY